MFFNKKIKIKNKIIGDKKIFIIAEAGSNHNGSFKNVIKLIDIAKKSGADAVKFQLYKSENLLKKKSDIKNLKKYEFNRSWITKTRNYCKKKNIILLFSAFDLEAIDIIKKNNLAAIKIGSSELTNLKLVYKAAKTGLPLIISTGMSSMVDIYECLDLIKFAGNKNVVLLQCSSIYPSPYKKVNLNIIRKFKQHFSFPIGFSDHSLGFISCLAASALGAKIIEKHFTIDTKLKGPDHSYASEPNELKFIVENIKKIPLLFGKEEKDLEYEESSLCRAGGLYANKNLRKNEKLSLKKIRQDWPRLGISTRYKSLVESLKIKKKILKGSPILWKDVFEK